MTDTKNCKRLMRGSMISMGIIFVSWMLQLAAPLQSEMVPGWALWAVGFLILLPVGLVGFVASTVAIARRRFCYIA